MQLPLWCWGLEMDKESKDKIQNCSANTDTARYRCINGWIWNRYLNPRRAAFIQSTSYPLSSITCLSRIDTAEAHLCLYCSKLSSECVSPETAHIDDVEGCRAKNAVML